MIPPITFSADSEENRDDVDLVRPGKPVRDEGKPETEDYFLEVREVAPVWSYNANQSVRS